MADPLIDLPDQTCRGCGTEHPGAACELQDALPQLVGGDTTGIYQKYRVERVDGRDRPGHKHEGCALFVLDLTHDPAARAAAIAYARATTDETLSLQLQAWTR